MTISPLALAAKKVIEAAWLHGPSYDLASQAAFALESTQMLQSPETAAEVDRLRARVVELETALRAVATQRGDAVKLIERERGYGEECVDIGDLEAALVVGVDETDGLTRLLAPQVSKLR